MKVLDIVFPNNNEQEFIEVAKALGTRELLFVYPLGKEKDIHQKENKIISKVAVLATAEQLQRKECQNNWVLLQSHPEKDRWAIEKMKPALLYGFEFQEQKDFMHQRNAGMNHVLAKLMAEKGITYGFPVAKLLRAPRYLQPVILGRLQQNIMLCKKYHVEIVLASFATDPMDMRNVKDMQCLVV